MNSYSAITIILQDTEYDEASSKYSLTNYQVDPMFSILLAINFVAVSTKKSRQQNLISLEQSYEDTCTDWLKTVFLILDRNTEQAEAVDVIKVRAKRINNLIIKVNKLFSFLCPSVF